MRFDAVRNAGLFQRLLDPGQDGARGNEDGDVGVLRVADSIIGLVQNLPAFTLGGEYRTDDVLRFEGADVRDGLFVDARAAEEPDGRALVLPAAGRLKRHMGGLAGNRLRAH